MDVQGCGYATFILKSDKSLWVIGNYPDPVTGGNYRDQFAKIADNVVEIRNCSHNTYCCYVLKDTGDLYVIGSKNEIKYNEKPEMIIADSGVTHLNGYFYKNEGNGMDTLFIEYFSYHKQDETWYLNINENGVFSTVKKHVNVNYADQFAFFYIDHKNKLYMAENYRTDEKTSVVVKDGEKIIDKNVKQCYGGEGITCGYLTNNGDLYMIGYNYKDVFGTGERVDHGVIKVAEDVKNIYRTDIGVHQPTLYFLKEDDSLWAIGDNTMVIGDGSVPNLIYQDNRSVYSEMGLTVTDTIKTPVKILDDVKEFTSNYYVKMAITKDGKRYVWGKNVVAAVATAFGYAANETDPEAYITSKRGTAVDCNQWLDERQTYRRKDIYLVPTLWEDVFGQPFPGD